MKRLALLWLWAMSVSAQQTVTLQGNVPIPAASAPYAQVITLVGLPSGCVASMDNTTATITLTGCPASLPVVVTVTCSPTSVNPGSVVNCSSTVTNAADNAVQWSSSSGTITPTGILTAPTTPGTVTITARSAQDNTKSGSAVVTVLSPGVGLKIESESAASSTLPGGGKGTITISPTQDVGDGNKVVTNVGGQSYDYTVSITTAGNYGVALRVCNFPNAVGTTSVHFEYPIGVNISGPLQLLNGTQWTTVAASSGKLVNLPAGPQTIRMVVDTMATSGVQTNWFSLTPVGGVQPSARLTWNPSTTAGVVGYNIYRSTVNGGSYSKINSAIIVGSPWVDTAVQSGITYQYVATALDGSNNESVYSNQVSVTMP